MFEELTIACWWWGDKYSIDYVRKLKAGVARNLPLRHRFIVISDKDAPGFERLEIPDPGLLEVDDGCYARLRMFDPDWRRDHDIATLLCLDLDTLIVGPLEPIMTRPEPLVVFCGGHFNPCPVNGSVMLVNYGAPAEVWEDFSVEDARAVSFIDGEWRGSDQTWIAHKVPQAAGIGPKDGVYGFQKPGWTSGDALMPGARIVTFPGKRDPANMGHLPWVKKNW